MVGLPPVLVSPPVPGAPPEFAPLPAGELSQPCAIVKTTHATDPVFATSLPRFILWTLPLVVECNRLGTRYDMRNIRVGSLISRRAIGALIATLFL